MNPTTQTSSDQLACRCLKVYRSQIESAVTEYGYSELQEVMDHTQAGKGCMACRKRLCQMIQNAKES